MRELPVHHARSIGSFAADIVAAGGEADVIAVFQRSFYLLCPKGIVAVCLEDLGNGPINILMPTRDGAPPWQGLVRDGMKANVAAGRIAVHGGFVLSLGQATLWSPPAWAMFEPGRVAAGISVIKQALGASSPLVGEGQGGGDSRSVSASPPPYPSPTRGEGTNIANTAARTADAGLAPLVFAPGSQTARTPTALAARDLVAALQRDLPRCLADQTWTADALRAATLLIGLGPGLTPSGDDLLGGLMLALAARGETKLRDALFDHIVDELNDLTVPVSAMHLTAAAHGQGHEALHALINSVLAADAASIAAHVETVAAIGATSGMDAIAGVVLGFEA